MEDHLHRIVVVGTSGVGKSTFAKRLATILSIPHVELDALHWEPNWTEAPDFRERVTQAVATPSWAIDGNYGKVREIIWQQARTLIWLDFPMYVIFARALKRAIKRAATREELWNGNRESWRLTFFSKESVLLWVLRSHDRQRRQYHALLTRPEYAHLKVHRFRSPKEANDYLGGLNGSCCQCTHV